MCLAQAARWHSKRYVTWITNLGDAQASELPFGALIFASDAVPRRLVSTRNWFRIARFHVPQSRSELVLQQPPEYAGGLCALRTNPAAREMVHHAASRR